MAGSEFRTALQLNAAWITCHPIIWWSPLFQSHLSIFNNSKNSKIVPTISVSFLYCPILQLSTIPRWQRLINHTTYQIIKSNILINLSIKTTKLILCHKLQAPPGSKPPLVTYLTSKLMKSPVRANVITNSISLQIQMNQNLLIN